MFNILLLFYSKLKCLSRYYKYAFFSKNHKKSAFLTRLLFPLRGGIVHTDLSVFFPRLYWYSWEWLIDIVEFGATISWNDDEITVAYDNVKLSTNAVDESINTVFFEMFRDDEYRMDEFNLEGLSILDVGANIGDSSIMLVRRGAKKVYAFEPLPILKKYLIKNICQNNYEDKIEVHSFGFSDKDEKVKIYMRKHGTAGTSAILHSQKKMNKKVGHIEQELELIDAEKYLKKIGVDNIDVLKMDCEHCEYVVFKNNQLLSYLNPTMIFLEYHAGYSDLQRLFNETGYSTKIYKKNDNVGILVATKDGVIID